MFEASNSRPVNRPGLHTPINTHLTKSSPQTSGSVQQSQLGNSWNTTNIRNSHSPPHHSKTSSASGVNLESRQQSRRAIHESVANKTRNRSNSAESRASRVSCPTKHSKDDGSVASSVDGVVRTINFDDDDTVTYTSSSTLRELFQNIDSVPVRDQGGEMQGYYNDPPLYSPRQSFLRGSNDSKVTIFPDSDSGFSSVRTRVMSGDEMSPQVSPGALVPSQSMNRLSGSLDLTSTPGPYVRGHFDRCLRNLQGTLEDSENRRCVLMHKLKEAQDTLELQSDRLGKIENSAKGNTILVEDLKLKENEYRKKIQSLERGQDERDHLKMENIRLRQEMQDRIDKLDFQLRSLQAQHQVSENENQKRITLLDQSTKALTMLESDNNQLQQDREALTREISVAKEAMKLARERFEPMEQENKSLRMEVMRLKEENADLTKKLAELSGQLAELRNLTHSMKDENEKLASLWKSLAEEKHSLAHQLSETQEKMADFKEKANSAGTEKDRLFQDKMDLNNKFQQLLVNKEQADRAKLELENQLSEMQDELCRAQKNVRKKEDERNRIEEALLISKEEKQALSSDLSSVRAYYERALEQISVLENGKKVFSQQQEWVVQEKDRLQNEVDRLSKLSDGKAKEMKREKEELEDAIQSLKGEARELRHENSLLHNKTQELDTKLRKANEDLKVTATIQQEELETWKDTCDRLTASVNKKEAEIQALLDRVEDLEEYTSKLKGENRSLKDECENLAEQHDDIKKLKDENRKLMQENAENEQVIKLLETQKEVLTKSSESSLAKLHDVEQLSGKCEQLRSDNEHLRERILELEKVRDNLISQKEELLASTELIYKKPKLEELEKKVEELRDTNKQLREINESVNERCENLEQKLMVPERATISMQQPSHAELLEEALIFPVEAKANRSMPQQGSPREQNRTKENTEMKDAMGGDGELVPRAEMNRVEAEKERLAEDMDHLRREYENLSERHTQYVEDYGPDGEVAQEDKMKIKQLKKEKEGLEKQVALINGQLLLVEGSKKRLDEVVEDLQHEIVHLRKELEEAEKQPVSNAEMEALQSEIDNLRGVLAKTQSDRVQQDKLIRSLKDDLDDEKNKSGTSVLKESLEDVGTDLNDMRGELHKLMGVIQSKDQAIETLEGQLRQSKEQIEYKERAMEEMKTLMENAEPRQSTDDSAGDQTPRRKSRSPNRTSRIPRRTDEEVQKRMSSNKEAKDGFRRLTPTNSYKSNHLSLREAHKMRTSDPEPSRSHSAGDKSSDRLQSLISKYRTHSESPYPERKIKPLSLQGNGSKMGLVTRGRSFGPAAPKDADAKVSVSSDHSESSVNGAHENGNFVEPIPSPELPTVKGVSPHGVGPLAQSSPTPLEASKSNTGDEGDIIQLKKKGVARKDRQGGGDLDIDDFPDFDMPIDEDDLDTQEQQDINALIQKQRAASGLGRPGGKKRSTHPKPLLSVSPPKITSKIIGDLLRTGPTSSFNNSMSPTSKSAPSSLLSRAGEKSAD